MTEPADHRERDRFVSELDRNFSVVASAVQRGRLALARELSVPGDSLGLRAQPARRQLALVHRRAARLSGSIEDLLGCLQRRDHEPGLPQ